MTGYTAQLHQDPPQYREPRWDPTARVRPRRTPGEPAVPTPQRSTRRKTGGVSPSTFDVTQGQGGLFCLVHRWVLLGSATTARPDAHGYFVRASHRSGQRPPRTCIGVEQPRCRSVELRGFEPLIPSMRTRSGMVKCRRWDGRVGEDRRLIGRLLHPYVRTGARAAGETRARA